MCKMKRGNHGFAEELLFMKNQRRDRSPQVPPLQPPMGSGAIPQVPPERRFAKQESQQKRHRFLNAHQRCAVYRRNCKTTKGISIVNLIFTCTSVILKINRFSYRSKKMPPRRHHKRKVRSNAPLFD